MSSWGSFDFSELKRFQQKLDKSYKSDLDEFCRDCAKELAARLLSKVIRRTPVGDYSKEVTVIAKRDSKSHKKGETYTKKVSTKTGGTLRRGWTAGKKAKGGAKGYARILPIIKQGNNYIVEIINPVEYASYVEFGHRTQGGKGWVEGRYMLTISENEIKAQSAGVLERKIDEFLRQVFS